MKEELAYNLREINRAIIVIQGQIADIVNRFEEIKKEAYKIILEIDDKFNNNRIKN